MILVPYVLWDLPSLKWALISAPLAVSTSVCIRHSCKISATSASSLRRFYDGVITAIEELQIKKSDDPVHLWIMLSSHLESSVSTNPPTHPPGSQQPDLSAKQCCAEGRRRGGIISWIGRPTGIRALSLVFIGTGAQMGGLGVGGRKRTKSKRGRKKKWCSIYIVCLCIQSCCPSCLKALIKVFSPEQDEIWPK